MWRFFTARLRADLRSRDRPAARGGRRLLRHAPSGRRPVGKGGADGVLRGRAAGDGDPALYPSRRRAGARPARGRCQGGRLASRPARRNRRHSRRPAAGGAHRQAAGSGGAIRAACDPDRAGGHLRQSLRPAGNQRQAEIETPSGRTGRGSLLLAGLHVGGDRRGRGILLPKRCSPWRLYYRPQQAGT